MNAYRRGREYREMYWRGRAGGRKGDGRRIKNLFCHKFL